MALSTWTPGMGSTDPLRLMDRMMRGMFSDPMMGELSMTPSGMGRGAAGGLDLVPVDIHETDNAFLVKADCPGLDAQDVSVEVNEGVLTISGRKDTSTEEKDREGRVVRRERAFTSFTRSFSLPEGVDPDNINASLDRGVLTVMVPKTEVKKTEPKRIAVQAAS